MTPFDIPSLAPPEKRQLTLGFLPLIDCAPLIIAREKGFFAEAGLDVSLSREGSWASIRDKVVIGLLDGAQMLAGIPLASTLGLGSPRVAMVTAFNIGLNGNAITLSNALLAATGQPASPASAAGLKAVIAQRRRSGMRPLKLAMVYPYSAHNYLLRYWLSAAGIDPDIDVQLTVVPPPQMAQHLKKGLIDGYSAGEPWNSMALELEAGAPIISSYDIWNNCPDKVFAVTERWAERYPDTHQALLCALTRAAYWLDRPEHKAETIALLNQPEYLDHAVSPHAAEHVGLSGTHFFRYAASYPWRSHALWFLKQMQYWGQIDAAVALKPIANRVYRPDIFRQVAERMRIAHPSIDCKPEGFHSNEWILQGPAGAITMGSDLFFNGATFDPNSC